MEKIAFIIGEQFLYWAPMILVIAAFSAMCAFVALQLGTGGKALGTFLVLPLSLILGILLGRLVHWYCRPDGYESLAAAMTDFASGSYALTGVAAGAVIAVCFARLIRALDNLPKAFDCLAIAGSLGIAVGRMNHLFNANDRGQVVATITDLPLVYPVANVVTGEPEYRLATFMLQAIVAGTLFVVLTVFFLVGKGKKTLRDGDTCLLFMLCYGASQVLFDSTRYDSLFLRSNGFVSMVQILGAVMMAVAFVLFSIRMVRANRWKWWYVLLWVGIVGGLTCAGIMEYFVQRRGNEAAMFYNGMSAGLLLTIGTAIAIYVIAVRAERKLAIAESLPKMERAQKAEPTLEELLADDKTEN